MKLRDLIPYIDKEDDFVILDIAGKHTTVQQGLTGMALQDLLNTDVIKIGRYRYDIYGDEDFLAIKLAYKKEEE